MKSPRENSTTCPDFSTGFGFCRPVCVHRTGRHTKKPTLKNQKTVLSGDEEQQIIDTFNNKVALDDFSVVVKYDEIKQKNYSLSAGHYFEVKVEYVDITHDEFEAKMKGFEDNLSILFAEGKTLETEIQNNLKGLKYEH